MTARNKLPDSRYGQRAAALAGARLMLVDSDSTRLGFNRQRIEREGGPDVEIATIGDEALDILGAKAQRFDVVTVWPWLADDETVDMFGVLRRCQSPVRLVAVTDATPAELGRVRRLAGAAAVEDSGQPLALFSTLSTVLAGDDTVEAIVIRRRVPASLTAEWARAIYGAAPGQRFGAALD
jgi:hypothetical protein